MMRGKNGLSLATAGHRLLRNRKSASGEYWRVVAADILTPPMVAVCRPSVGPGPDRAEHRPLPPPTALCFAQLHRYFAFI